MVNLGTRLLQPGINIFFRLCNNPIIRCLDRLPKNGAAVKKFWIQHRRYHTLDSKSLSQTRRLTGEEIVFTPTANSDIGNYGVYDGHQQYEQAMLNFNSNKIR